MRGLFGTLAGGAEAKQVGFEQAYRDFMELQTSKTGVSVTTLSAIRVSTVLAGTRVLAEGVAQQPCIPYEVLANGGKKPAVNDTLFRILMRQPNEWMTPFEFRELMMWHAVLARGAYAYINRGMSGDRVRELLPLAAGSVVPVRLPNFEVVYEVSDADGLIGRYPAKDLLRLRGPSWDGVNPIDIVREAREAIGLAIATEEAHARLHSNGMQPGGILSIDPSLSDEARNRIIKQVKEQKSGLSHAFKTLVLDKGASFSAMSMKGVDTQHLETRRFQIEEVCRALRIFPQMVGHTDKTATFASAEAFFQAHVTHSLMPWLVRFEQAMERDLLKADSNLIIRHDVRSLMRGSAKDRSEFYAKALGAGGGPAWMTQDEVRAEEDLNPMGGEAAVLPKPTNVAPTAKPAPAIED